MPSLPETFAHGKIELQGQFMLGSNYTFLVDVTHAGETIPAVYKPSRGQRIKVGCPKGCFAITGWRRASEGLPCTEQAASAYTNAAGLIIASQS